MYRARLSTDEWLEAENFKSLYDAALSLVMYYLEGDILHVANIEVDGVDKYQITPTIWMSGAECIGKSIEVVRLEDWSCITARSMDGTNQRAKRAMNKYLSKLSDPETLKEDISRAITSIAGRFSKDRKGYDKIAEELNKMCYNM